MLTHPSHQQPDEQYASRQKKLHFTKEKIIGVAKEYPTPFYLYDEGEIQKNAGRFLKAFGILPGFRNYFAVKATPNPYILKILKNKGMGADCSSLAELELAALLGMKGEDIMFTSNDTPLHEYARAKEIGAIINLDDISHIPFLGQIGLPDLICLRYNPGPSRTGNLIIGDPKEAKYGFTKEQLFEGYRMCMEKGVKRFGLHTMVVSNELNEPYFVETARMLFELVAEVKHKLGITLEFVNLGGGIGIPYLPDQKAVNYEHLAHEIKKIYDEVVVPSIGEIKVFMECGRVITGPYGNLITTVLHLKHIYKDYVGCDACMANLMRPAVYGAYHHITVLGKEQSANTHQYDVTGSLCENNDKFAINRLLPKIDIGDILVFHDAGAHGHAMGFNYNGKLRSAELLLRVDGSVLLIRRAETVDDYFKTLDFKKLEHFS